jgi:hypothetical protein
MTTLVVIGYLAAALVTVRVLWWLLRDRPLTLGPEWPEIVLAGVVWPVTAAVGLVALVLWLLWRVATLGMRE